MTPDPLFHLSLERMSAQIIAKAHERKQTLATAESCTGGLLSAYFTKIPGASQVFLGGVVAYANAVKSSLLDIPQEILTDHGAVSAETARLMAENIRGTLDSDLACSITGVAGPGGGTIKKPAGLVYIAIACKTRPLQIRENFFPPQGRDFVRTQAVQTALEMINENLDRIAFV